MLCEICASRLSRSVERKTDRQTETDQGQRSFRQKGIVLHVVDACVEISGLLYHVYIMRFERATQIAGEMIVDILEVQSPSSTVLHSARESKGMRSRS